MGKNYQDRIIYNLPKYLKNEWFAKVIHMKEYKLPPAFDKDNNFIEYKVSDVVPMKKLENGLFAFYKIVKISFRRGDWLYDSDGYKYDLKYSHVAPFI